MSRLNIAEAQLGTARDAVPPDPIASEKARGYRIFRIRIDTTSRTSAPIKVEGTHLTVLEVVSQHAVGIALNRGGQFIPIREGDEITREFSEFRVRNFGPLIQAGGTQQGVYLPGPCEVMVLVSYGRIVRRQPVDNRFAAAFPIFKGTATATGVSLFDGIVVASQPLFRFRFKDVAKWGGTVMIRNLHPANNIMLYMGGTGGFNNAGTLTQSPTSAWQIFPGEVLTLDTRCRVSTAFVTLAEICLATAAGTADYNVMLSNWGDSTDPSALTDGGTDLEYSSGV